MKTSKRVAVIGALLGLFLLPIQSEAGARIYVRFGPPTVKVKVIKPVKACRNVVWVNGHYNFKNGRYVWVNGYWVRPRPGFYYAQGHWKKTRHGHYYISGRWVRG